MLKGESGSEIVPGRSPCCVVGVITVVSVSVLLDVSFPVPAMALHEVDHRFTVEGRICGPDGHSRQNVKVTVKNTRGPQRFTATTDDDGYYKATLHLHDENQGDPLLVKTDDEEKTVRVDFDPEDRKTERITTVNLGQECPATVSAGSEWIYYGIGAGLAAAGLAGAKIMRDRRRRRESRGKGRRQGRV